MRKRRKKSKYRTHPLIKAALAMSLLLTAAVCAASYGFYRYISVEEEATLKMRDRCAYEAYLSLCENLGRREMRAAADALSRCELFGGCGEADFLRAAIMSEDVGEDVALILREGLDGSVSVSESVRRADEASRQAAGKKPEVKGQSVGTGYPFWATLECRSEIGSAEARRIAENYIGGVSLAEAENHTFPLVYTYTCKNASADITRAGGYLLRMYVYRHGGAEEKGQTSCREAAERFITDAGISDFVLLSETEVYDGYDYVFCGTFSADGEEAVCTGEIVKLGVSRRGAAVSFFDAVEYYKNRPVSHSAPEIKINREKASSVLGVDGENLTLVYTEGELFWRFSGVKTLLCDAENGEIRVENP